MPEPARVRFAMAGFSFLGGLVGSISCFVSLWGVHFTLDTAAAARCWSSFALGAVTGLAVMAVLSSRGIRSKHALAPAAILVAVAAWGASYLYEPAWLPLPFAAWGLGAAAAACSTASSLRATLTLGRAGCLLNLAGACFGLGAVSSVGALWMLSAGLTLPSLLQTFALVLAAFAGLVQLTGWFSFPPGEPFVWAHADLREVFQPAAILLGFALALMALQQSLLAGWLAFYVNRRFGWTAESGMAVLLMFWIAWTTGRALAVRLPAIDRTAAPILTASLPALIGCAFLLKTLDLSGALVGAMLAGLGPGALQPLVFGSPAGKSLAGNASFLAAWYVAALVGGFGLLWAVGPLSPVMAVSGVIYASLAVSLAVPPVLALVVMEVRLGRGATAVR